MISRLRSKITRLTLFGGLLFASSLAFGQVSQDGGMLTTSVEPHFVGVSASDTQNLLSMQLRVTGPHGFHFEETTEFDSIDWVPEADLPDGIYHWEATLVVPAPGASPIEPLPMRRMEQAQADGTLDTEMEDSLNHKLENTPLIRYYRPSDRQIETRSGTFRVTDGFIEPMEETDNTFSQHQEPNLLMRVAGRILHTIVPSAHAEEEFNENVRIQKSAPSLYFENTGSGGGEWRWMTFANTDMMTLEDQTGSTNRSVLRAETGIPANTLRLSSATSSRPQIGVGTSSPSTTLHLRSSSPRIRLEEIGGDSWYIRNTNQGVFEVTEATSLSGGVGPFAIAPDSLPNTMRLSWGFECILSNCWPSARVGIGTDSPSTDLEIGSTGVFSPRIRLSGLEESVTMTGGESFHISTSQVSGNRFTVHGPTGNVGIGTTSPSQNLEISSSSRTAMIMNAPDGEQTDFTFQKDGTDRWAFRSRASNDNFEITRLNSPDGTDIPFSINHSSGIVNAVKGMRVWSGSTPPTPGNGATLFVDQSDGNLKARFPNGNVVTIASN